jgi:hypothetical protein
MTLPIDGVSAAAQQGLRFDNIMPDAGGEAGLSDMARGVLSKIGELQAGFEQNVASAIRPGESAMETGLSGTGAAAAPTQTSGAERTLASVQSYADQIQQSTVVQTQLAKFVMASSISSSLGRNLNTFLKGQ